MKGKLISYKKDSFIALNSHDNGYWCDAVIEKSFFGIKYKVKCRVLVSYHYDLEDFIGKKVKF